MLNTSLNAFHELLIDRKVIVSCVNKQPGSSIDEFTNGMKNISIILTRSLYLYGDFNISLLNYDNHSENKFFVDQLLTMSLFPLINKLTRIARLLFYHWQYFY